MGFPQTDAPQTRQTRTPAHRPAAHPGCHLYVVKCGCPWRYLPTNFPPWKTVYHVFRQWTLNHEWAALNDALRTLVRKNHGKRSRPTAAILDSQSVKSAGHGGRVGYDAGKRIKGRKRHLLVDTLGLVLGVAVTPANTTERDGAQLVLGRVLGWFTWLRILWVDGGYTGETFAQWVKGLRPKLAVEVVKRSDAPRASKYCRAAGWWSAPSAGSCASGDWCAIMRPPSPAPKRGSISP